MSVWHSLSEMYPTDSQIDSQIDQSEALRPAASERLFGTGLPSLRVDIYM